MSGAVLTAPRGAASWSGGGASDVALPRNQEELRARADEDIARRFAVIAEQLAEDAAGVSAPRRLMRHPAYLEILSMGEAAVPLLLRRLQAQGGRPVWLSLLGMITASPPGLGTETIGDAAVAWVQWGKLGGYLNRRRGLRPLRD